MNARSALALGILSSIWIADAFGEDNKSRDGGRHGPPPVAIEACVAAVEGDACLFEGRQGEDLEGSCAVTPDEVLACRPENGRPPPRHRGPDEETEG